jgi:hypothetical protein
VSRRPAKNVAASVHRRLLDRAKERVEDPNLVFQRYALERFLYRLSRSKHVGSFMLKGAMLFAVWEDEPHRPTRDIDLLGLGDDSADRIRDVFVDVCRAVVPDDGMVFEPGSVLVEDIREGQAYQGKRVAVKGKLGSARFNVQVDIGFGDALVHTDRTVTFPTLLDMPAPELRAYPVEAVIAEKIHAIIQHDVLNSRMKDFYDLYVLSQRLPFDGQELAAALRATLGRRGVRVTPAQLRALLSKLEGDDVAVTRWRAFLRKNRLDAVEFAVVADALLRFLVEPLQALDAAWDGAATIDFARSWPAGGPWT